MLLFSPKSQINHLHSKSLKEDESLEKCEVAEPPEGRNITRWHR